MKIASVTYLVPSTALLAFALLQCSAGDEMSPKAHTGGSSGSSGSTGTGGALAGAGGSTGGAAGTAAGSGGAAGVGVTGGAAGAGGSAGGDTGGTTNVGGAGAGGSAGDGGAGAGGAAGSGGGAGSGGTAGTGGASGSGGGAGAGGAGGSGGRSGAGGGGAAGSGGTGGTGGAAGTGGTTVDSGTIDNGPAPATYTDSKGVTWKLVWHDEFDGTAVNTANWAVQDYCNVQNGELQCYHPANVTVKDGVLTMEAREESGGGKNYTSGKIMSRGKQSFMYGRISARMILPALEGMWPAWWLLGNGGSWPRDGEIDVMEARGRVPREVEGTAHWGSNNTLSGKRYTFPSGQDFTGWHVYGFEWSATSLSFYVDDAPFYHSLSQPMDACFVGKAFYLILNLAVGGNFDGFKAPPAGMAPQKALVDWVRVYQVQ